MDFAAETFFGVGIQKLYRVYVLAVCVVPSYNCHNGTSNMKLSARFLEIFD
jgi:hypothetical protein